MVVAKKTVNVTKHVNKKITNNKNNNNENLISKAPRQAT